VLSIITVIIAVKKLVHLEFRVEFSRKLRKVFDINNEEVNNDKL